MASLQDLENHSSDESDSLLPKSVEVKDRSFVGKRRISIRNIRDSMQGAPVAERLKAFEKMSDKLVFVLRTAMMDGLQQLTELPAAVRNRCVDEFELYISNCDIEKCFDDSNLHSCPNARLVNLKQDLQKTESHNQLLRQQERRFIDETPDMPELEPGGITDASLYMDRDMFSLSRFKDQVDQSTKIRTLDRLHEDKLLSLNSIREGAERSIEQCRAVLLKPGDPKSIISAICRM